MTHDGALAPAWPADGGRVLTTGFLAHRLGTARRRLDMSQHELARRLGVDQSTVSRLEGGDMHGPPWPLVLRACLLLGIEPHALMTDEPETAGPDPQGAQVLYPTCRPISVAQAKVAQRFLHLGDSQVRLPDLLRHCLSDTMRVRPSVVGLSLLLFKGTDWGTRLCHVQWRQGEIYLAERLESEQLPALLRLLKETWEQGETVVRDGRPEVPRWTPFLSVDRPVDQGLVGFDFTDDENLERDGSIPWVEAMAGTFAAGLGAMLHRRQRGHSTEMREIAARLTAIEVHLADGGNGHAPGDRPGA